MYPAYLEKGGKVLDEVAPVKTPAFVYVAGDDKLRAECHRVCRSVQGGQDPMRFHQDGARRSRVRPQAGRCRRT